MPTNDDHTTIMAMLKPFLHIKINYLARKQSSAYSPSCLMMDYIVHIMNDCLCDSNCFKRDAPHYHPYILRLYYGVIFWIQCLRAGLEARKLPSEQHQFLLQFLESHSLESLPIAAPLLPLFKTLCTSQPEYKIFGLVYPQIPSEAGPCRRDAFMREIAPSFFLPNIPGVFALLDHLNSLATAPSKQAHIPVTETATAAVVFGHYSFPPLNERTDFEKYALCSAGLQYLCEADKKLNEEFAERYTYFQFPVTRADDDLRPIANFLHMNEDMEWFTRVKAVAAIAARYFTGSETLADCSPSGVAANQYVCKMQTPAIPPTPPRQSADRQALFPFAFRLCTTLTSPPTPLTEAMAAMAQTHIQMFPTHPYLGQFGNPVGTGPFWDVRPIEMSSPDESAYLSLRAVIKSLMLSKTN
ncbi:unnamed protein product [Vicia faba]|uniref:Uncharacterized protein n=1 Tax=Vicia faba TaxID=3906 RepID=A0AAV0YJY9_VICFA|nr:unnamed protein product [Vicia faba]